MVQCLRLAGPEMAPARAEIESARDQALAGAALTLHPHLRWNPGLDRGCAELLRHVAGGPDTAAAAEAGLGTVLAEGRDPAAAVRALLTTVRGRVALFDVGTIEAGVAFADGHLCVDTGSLRHPVMTDFTWCWPAPEAAHVPTGYLAGEPVPEAGVDPATLGYPLTVQIGLVDQYRMPRLTLRLIEAGSGDHVDCLRFDPDHPLPGGDDLQRTFGILPRQPLRSRAKYVFEVFADLRERAHIEFTAGR
jgi:hypothetical protein